MRRLKHEDVTQCQASVLVPVQTPNESQYGNQYHVFVHLPSVEGKWNFKPPKFPNISLLQSVWGKLVLKSLCNQRIFSLKPNFLFCTEGPFQICIVLLCLHWKLSPTKIPTLQWGCPTPVQTGPIQKFSTLIRKEPNFQNSAFSRKDYRIYLYHIFDLIFQPITPFVELRS
jgi:hypothetical protein